MNAILKAAAIGVAATFAAGAASAATVTNFAPGAPINISSTDGPQAVDTLRLEPGAGPIAVTFIARTTWSCRTSRSRPTASTPAPISTTSASR